MRATVRAVHRCQSSDRAELPGHFQPVFRATDHDHLPGPGAFRDSQRGDATGPAPWTITLSRQGEDRQASCLSPGLA